MVRFGLTACWFSLPRASQRAASPCSVSRLSGCHPITNCSYTIAPLTIDDQKALTLLKESVRRTNVTIVPIDLTGDESDKAADHKAIWDREGKDAKLPWVALRYPEAPAKSSSVWSGLLGDAKPDSLFNSPGRRAVFDRLTSGYTGVVVLLRSGDAKADAAARELLQKELPVIAGRIELPAKTEEGPQVQSVLPLFVHFAIVEVSREPAEDAFVRMLVGSEDGLDKERGPIAYVVFGRGRAQQPARQGPYRLANFSVRSNSSVGPARAK